MHGGPAVLVRSEMRRSPLARSLRRVRHLPPQALVAVPVVLVVAGAVAHLPGLFAAAFFVVWSTVFVSGIVRAVTRRQQRPAWAPASPPVAAPLVCASGRLSIDGGSATDGLLAVWPGVLELRTAASCRLVRPAVVFAAGPALGIREAGGALQWFWGAQPGLLEVVAYAGIAVDRGCYPEPVTPAVNAASVAGV